MPIKEMNLESLSNSIQEVIAYKLSGGLSCKILPLLGLKEDYIALYEGVDKGQPKKIRGKVNY